jgi:hypothetical protein
VSRVSWGWGLSLERSRGHSGGAAVGYDRGGGVAAAGDLSSGGGTGD